MTVSWSNNSLPTGVIKTGVRALNLPANHKSRVIERTHIQKFVNTNVILLIETGDQQQTKKKEVTKMGTKTYLVI